MGETLRANPAGTGDLDEDTRLPIEAVRSAVPSARIVHLDTGPPRLTIACTSVRHSERRSGSCGRPTRTALSRAPSALCSRARDALPALLADPGAAGPQWAELAGDPYQHPGLGQCR